MLCSVFAWQLNESLQLLLDIVLVYQHGLELLVWYFVDSLATLLVLLVSCFLRSPLLQDAFSSHSKHSDIVHSLVF